jgi:hypothetical protein
MPIFITSSIDGFRRAGLAHPKGTTEYPDGKFTEEQLRQLHNEPLLAVIDAIGEVDGQEAGSDDASQGGLDESGLGGDLTKMKVADLVEIAQAGGIDSKGLNKAELIAAIEAKRESGAAE